MSAFQLSFSLRVATSGVKTIHLLGSWDNYAGQLPLSRDRNSSKSGAWKGTFRFQNAVLEPGRRYWYYYIIDGYHVAHNPSVASTTEPTTGRVLNILDVEPSREKHGSSKKSGSSSRKSSSSSMSSSSWRKSRKSGSASSTSPAPCSSSTSRSGHRSSRPRVSLSVDIPKGRPLSVSQIQAPMPISPYATQKILSSDYYDDEEVERLMARFCHVAIDSDDDNNAAAGASPVSSTGSSLSSRSESSSPGSSMSGYSTPGSECSTCTCDRYGITRSGERIKLDCGGSWCGYGDGGSPHSSSAGHDDRIPIHYSRHSSRRNGFVLT